MILHITTKDEWKTAVSHPPYTAPSLQTENFIHCSTPEQLLIPANAMFRGQTNLILLCLDTSKITADIIYEDCYESGIEFPHIYGPINIDAVIKTVDFPPNEDGTFSLPSTLL